MTPAAAISVLSLVAALAALPAASHARVRDSDRDGLSNRRELRKTHTNPHRWDTDRDRLGDGYEVRKSRTNPRRKDTDRDGLRDRYELRRSHTNPRRADTDGDGVKDGRELRLGTNPLKRDAAGPPVDPGAPGGPAPPPPGTCMPDPSACGFPDLETVGARGALPQVNGTVKLSSPGQVLQNALVVGSIIVTAPNVTIRNVKLVMTDPWYGIRAFDGEGVGNLVVEDVEIDMNGHLDAKAIAFDEYTLRRALIHNGSDCAHFGDNVVIADSLCVSGPDANGDAWPDSTAFCSGPEHIDGFQSDGGENITLRHNTIRNPCDETSAILMSTNTSGIANVRIEDNLMTGGGYTLYCNAGPDVPNEIVTGNRFARTWHPKGGYWGAITGCNKADVFSGNVWDVTGAPL
jgi:Bacterial TSP3 repeat